MCMCEGERDIDKEIQRDKETEIETQRGRQRQIDRDTETERNIVRNREGGAREKKENVIIEVTSSKSFSQALSQIILLELCYEPGFL